MAKTTKQRLEDPLWHVYAAVLVALILQILLPEKLVFGPRFILPALEGLLLIVLSLTSPKKPYSHPGFRRSAAVGLIALTSIANASSVLLLARYLLKGGKVDGTELLVAAINIFFTNIIVFGLWYWEIDAGGPADRYEGDNEPPDFLFPQYDVVSVAPPGWRPTFLDYLYVSMTNATAFSPTDTLPLTHKVKLLMGSQALISLITLALVAARAVNILS